MMKTFEELDYRQTALGALELRRRRPVSMPETWVYEVKLDGRFLMSSLNHTSEVALADVGLAFLAEGQNAVASPWRVMVGGLGLGHTAEAALRNDRVGELEVFELLPEVIRWHESGLVPLGQILCDDPRCTLVRGDALATLARGAARVSEVQADSPHREPHREPLRDPLRDPLRKPLWDAVLIDIDDSPEHLLAESHGGFYTDDGLRGLRSSLTPGGIAAIWSSLPVEGFEERLETVFGHCIVYEAVFHNALLMEDELNPIYMARRTD